MMHNNYCSAKFRVDQQVTVNLSGLSLCTNIIIFFSYCLQEYLKKPSSERSFTTSVLIPVRKPKLERLNKLKNASTWKSESQLVCHSCVKEVNTNMSHRYKDSQSQPSSLPRRYYSLPKNYSTPSTNNGKDSSHSTKYRSVSSSSATTPSTQSLRYGSLRTYGASTNSSLTDDIKKPTSRRTGNSSISTRPIGISSIPRKSSYGNTSFSSASSSTRDTTPSYTSRHVSSIPHRSSGSSSLSADSNWTAGGPPVRQRSSITLRETQPVWGPEGPPVRQHSSSSLRDSPFTMPTRRMYSSSQAYSDSETRTSSSRKSGPVESLSTNPISTSSVQYKGYNESEETQRTSYRRKLSPTETTSSRRTSPPAVHYEGSLPLKSEKPASPTSPTVSYSGSIPRKDSPSSKSEASTTSSSRRGSGSSDDHAASSDNNDDEIESTAARDISLLSREIASVYEGSLSRSDSRKGKGENVLKNQESTEGKRSRKNSKQEKQEEKQLLNEKKINMSGKSSREQSPGSDTGFKFKKGHTRSSSTGSTPVKDEKKSKPVRKISGIFSRKKSRESTDSEDDDERLQGKSPGLFSRKDSKDSVKDNSTRGSSSSSPPVSPATPPKRKISGPGRLFSFSSDSKTTPEMPQKFSVPGKYFASKDAKSGGESSDLESEGTRPSRPPMKRRVSLPGIFSLPRSSSAERTSGGRRPSPEPAVDPALLQRRRSNFKKAQSFDVQSDKAKNSMLSKLKFWDHTKKDKSPDSRYSTSPEEGRSRSVSPAVESPMHKVSTGKESEHKTTQSRRSRERIIKQKSLEEKEASDTTKALTGDEKSQVSPKVTNAGQDANVSKTVKEPKVQYIGPVETPTASELRARKKAQYKGNSVEKESESTVKATENQTQAKNSETSNANKAEVKPLDASDGSTRDTVSKLRERRRQRREQRERFFAGMEPVKNSTKGTSETTQKDCLPVEPDSSKNVKSTATVVATKDKVDGRTISPSTKQENKNQKVTVERRSDKQNGQIPKQSVIRKTSTADDVLEKSKVRSGKPRYQTIASSVHADIINDLIREKGLKTTTNTEVKIPSVSELRAKFLISKDDAKVIPPRPILKLDDRPHSICGEILSPTEMKKFEDITFSLARKVSSDDVKMDKKLSNSGSGSLPKLDSQWKTIPTKNNEISPPSSPSVDSKVKKEKKVKNAVKEEDQVAEESGSPESDTLKKRRGSKKKRKKSIFGSDKEKGSDKDKEAKTPEEEADLPQHGAVSAAIKAMFSRKPYTSEKIKVSRKQRAKTVPINPSENREISKAEIESRERKKSAPVSAVVQKSPDVKAQPLKVEKKVEKDEKIEKKQKVKDLEKEKEKVDEKEKSEKDIELQPIEDLEQKPVKERKSLKKRKCTEHVHCTVQI